MTLPRLKRALLLPLAAIGLALVLPWKALELIHGWNTYAAASAAPVALPDDRSTAASGAESVDAHSATSSQLPAGAPSCDASSTAEDLPADAAPLAAVVQRNQELNQREHALQTRELQLAAATKLAKEQMAELEKLRQSVQALVVNQTAASRADMQLLVGLYSNMKPMQAAAVLSKLDASKTADILQHLEMRAAGPILAAMDPASAVKVTEVLQQRHAAFEQ